MILWLEIFCLRAESILTSYGTALECTQCLPAVALQFPISWSQTLILSISLCRQNKFKIFLNPSPLEIKTSQPGAGRQEDSTNKKENTEGKKKILKTAPNHQAAVFNPERSIHIVKGAQQWSISGFSESCSMRQCIIMIAYTISLSRKHEKHSHKTKPNPVQTKPHRHCKICTIKALSIINTVYTLKEERMSKLMH